MYPKLEKTTTKLPDLRVTGISNFDSIKFPKKTNVSCLPGDSRVVPVWLWHVFLLGISIYYPKRHYIGVSRYELGASGIAEMPLLAQDARYGSFRISFQIQCAPSSEAPHHEDAMTWSNGRKVIPVGVFHKTSDETSHKKYT